MDERLTEKKQEYYYYNQGCGIATGMLLSALHNANLTALTSTPLGAESEILELLKRPANEKVFLLIPVGYPAKNATVPYRTQETIRKPLHEIMQVV